MDQSPVTQDVLAHQGSPSRFWRILVKKLRLGFVTAALLFTLFIAQADITHAGCKSDAGQCIIAVEAMRRV